MLFCMTPQLRRLSLRADLTTSSLTAPDACHQLSTLTALEALQVRRGTRLMECACCAPGNGQALSLRSTRHD
jgi:hypothetical protein